MGSFLGIQVSILLFPKRNVVKFPEEQVNLPGLLKKIDKTKIDCSVRISNISGRTCRIIITWVYETTEKELNIKKYC